MATTTDIVAFKRSTLANPARIKLLATVPEVLDGLAQQFPGEGGHDKAQSLLRQAYIHIANSKACTKLCACTGESFLQALLDCASLDLSLTKALGEAYLVPFKGVCSMMPGYRGFITLLHRTGLVQSIQVEAVYEGDEFRIEAGTDPRLKHVIAPDVPRDWQHLRGVYCIINHTDGPPSSEWMNMGQIGKVQKSSKAADGPWRYWPVEMAKKSVIRRIQKLLPKRADDLWARKLLQAVEMDNRDFGLMQSEAKSLLKHRADQMKLTTEAEADKTADDYAAEAAAECDEETE